VPVQALAALTPAALAALQLDVVISIDGSACSAAVAGAARLGSLALVAADPRLGPDAELGFWECFHAWAKTGYALDDASGRRYAQGFYKTRERFAHNHAVIVAHGCRQLALLLSRVAGGADWPAPLAPLAPAPAPAGRASLLDELCYLARVGWRRLHYQWRGRYQPRHSRWTLAAAEASWRTVFDGAAPMPAMPDRHFWADPFLLEEGGQTYCFFEDYDEARRLGHIAVLRRDGDRWRELGPCLIEPEHLSFPYLLRYQDELYMCPEISASRQIRLYRCVEFPMRWECSDVLMDQVAAADTMLFPRAGKWWMLTNLDPGMAGDHCSELHLFHADSPRSSHWTAHPNNPVKIDSDGGRNGGLLWEGERLFRVGQRQGYCDYGAGLIVHEVVALDEQHYVEREVMRVDGSHHLCSSGGLTIFDRKQRLTPQRRA
ncbi:hypothetical protein GTP46_25015, partial [Duganella sp. FT135W]|nr:hypothetical protein [Duganella flavida]